MNLHLPEAAALPCPRFNLYLFSLLISLIPTDNGYGRIELAVVVEQRQVVHLGERLVRVRIVRGALHSGPTADPEIKNNM